MNAHQLRVDCRPSSTGWLCRVTVGDDPAATEHEVEVTTATLARFAPGADQPTRLVAESFRFMLEREPRQAILRQFELPLIEHYFPEYPAEISRRLVEGR
ncbi:hypothetical protein BH23CHL7_BH23CHL7_05590 [soil metagenome]